MQTNKQTENMQKITFSKEYSAISPNGAVNWSSHTKAYININTISTEVKLTCNINIYSHTLPCGMLNSQNKKFNWASSGSSNCAGWIFGGNTMLSAANCTTGTAKHKNCTHGIFRLYRLNSPNRSSHNR